MSYKWKKAIANAAAIWVGVLIAKMGMNPEQIHWTWAFWKPVIALACSTTFFAEIRYIYSWLEDIANDKEVPHS